jgi:excinuclease ABC subunit B
MKQATEIADSSKILKKKLTKEEKIELINELEEEMKAYAKELNFEMAAQIRDAIMELKAAK